MFSILKQSNSLTNFNFNDFHNIHNFTKYFYKMNNKEIPIRIKIDLSTL